MNKHKGSNAERELVRIFSEQGWAAARIAGSGVNDNSPADIIAGKLGKRGYIIECKSSKSSIIYIKKQQIEDFVLFSKIIGLEPVIATRFNYEGWLFIKPEQLRDSGKYWAVSLKDAKVFGKKFGQFFEFEQPIEINI